MARQGKYNSSPFHVETAQYKYAIEHEVDSRLVQQSIVSCDSLDKSKTRCTRWNSGYSKCENHRCLYYNEAKWRLATCEECAFFYETVCFHRNKPGKQVVDYEDARICCFFFPPEKDQRQHALIRSCCVRYSLTQDILGCERRIASKNNYIKQALKEISSGHPSDSDSLYLQNKIGQKARERQEQEELLQLYNQKLSKFGGRLMELPWMKKTKP